MNRLVTSPFRANDGQGAIRLTLQSRAAGKLSGGHGRSRGPRTRVSERRARLMVRCACELLGVEESAAGNDLYLPMSVAEFENELRARYAVTHPELVYRTEVTIQRARLERPGLPNLPRVVLRQGGPPRR